MSANSIQFTAISGANNEDAVCYLLEIDEAKILLDCGSFEEYSGEGLAQLQRVARQVDAVLLSHADAAHVGAYPVAFERWGLTCAAYATQAVAMMGRVCMHDVTKALRAREDFELFDERAVDRAFDNVTALQYSQPVSLGGRHSGITVTAHAAGHSVGGAVWTISNGAETVLYAMDYNHMREAHLGGSSLLVGGQGRVNERLARPSLLITDAYNAQYRLPPRRRRVEAFVDAVGQAVRRGGNVLVPVDSAARVLEIAYVLNEWWGRDRARRESHTLYLLGRCSRKARAFAQSLVGWMADGLGSATPGAGSADTKPFDLRHVVAVQSLAELDRRMGQADQDRRGGGGRRQQQQRARHAVVLASLDSMSLGFAQDLFVRWAGARNNAVVMPQRGPPGSLARRLYTRWLKHTQRKDVRNGAAEAELVRPARLPVGSDIAVTLRRRVALQGAELEAWQAQERRRCEEAAAREAMLRRERTMADSDAVGSDADSDGDGDSDGEADAAAVDLAAPLSELDLAMERLRSGLSYDLHIGGLRDARCTFPFQEKLRRADEYGEIFDTAAFELAPEPDDSTNLAHPGGSDAGSDGGGSDDEFGGRPTKAIREERRVAINCQLAFVDLEGRADGTSASNILVQLMPKRVVIVHGSAAATQALAEHCRDPQVPVTKEIYTPGLGETLNVASGLNAYRLRLTDALLRQVRMHAVGASALGFVAGRVRYASDDGVPVLDVDAGGARDAAWQPATTVGDARLSALRAVLAAHSIAAHFDAEGTLVCGPNVAVQRRPGGTGSGSAGIRLLGTPSPEYYAIRSIVYGHFVSV
ncbi:beta-lactamase-like protein [Kickxella alabastrina]|uniref:beta-lactamase-like protein n=1 Tax=Kickxella alabastrina TaxID=61397 RepID=UPI002220248B|nr:beta-lactamase-like protein [Kickxella alabastrina]KAI7828481.1 beta-lactamase-like protein [Kickxella alabastrina]